VKFSGCRFSAGTDSTTIKRFGFDTESSKMTSGLGFISMRERLVGGRLSIGSRPFQGTQIEVTVPLRNPAELMPRKPSRPSQNPSSKKGAFDEHRGFDD
jgi:hypothetical protein